MEIKDYKSTPDNRTIDVSVFEGNFVSFFRLQGADIFGRTKIYTDWLRKQKELQIWLYDKRNLSAPEAICKGEDEYGNKFEGVNFASADYMGLSHHPDCKEAAAKVAIEYGIGSGGSPLAFGVHKYYLQLRNELAEFWGVKSVIIYSMGWMAGYGVVKGLVRPDDNVVMDKLSHNCLQEGAMGATRKIHFVNHVDIEDYTKKIKELRETDPENGIFVITEGLFSMDSDTMDLNKLQQVCKQYQAVLILDCAHDFGCMGENGKGTWELQGLKDKSNVIFVATGSKSLSTNMGFAGCDNENITEYLKIFSSTYMFANSISPIQAATALANLNIIRGEEGKRRRRLIQENAIYLRAKLESKGYKCLGYPSPIVPLLIGNEAVTRICARLMLDEGVPVNSVEFPVSPRGQARFRVCVLPIHEKKHLDMFVESFVRNMQKAKELLARNIDGETAKALGLVGKL